MLVYFALSYPKRKCRPEKQAFWRQVTMYLEHLKLKLPLPLGPWRRCLLSSSYEMAMYMYHRTRILASCSCSIHIYNPWSSSPIPHINSNTLSSIFAAFSTIFHVIAVQLSFCILFTSVPSSNSWIARYLGVTSLFGLSLL